MHLADAFIQSDLQCIQVIHLLSVHVFPGNWTHNLCAADAMLYHWATQEHYLQNIYIILCCYVHATRGHNRINRTEVSLTVTVDISHSLRCFWKSDAHWTRSTASRANVLHTGRIEFSSRRPSKTVNLSSEQLKINLNNDPFELMDWISMTHSLTGTCCHLLAVLISDFDNYFNVLNNFKCQYSTFY